MQYGEISKMVIMHFIVAVVITVMVVFALSSVKIDNMAYLGVLLGLYIFAGYGINRLDGENLIESKSQKLILAIICIVIFYLFFSCVMPFIFNMAIFGLVNVGGTLTLDFQMIFLIFSLLVLAVSLR